MTTMFEPTSSAALRPWALLPLLFLVSLALGCPPQEKAVLQWDETPPPLPEMKEVQEAAEQRVQLPPVDWDAVDQGG